MSHYRIGFLLGRGGMGDVYAGFDETLNRRVAMKAIRAEHRLRADLKTRFLREARILSSLDHPNICRVYDYIEAEDNDWLVLQLVEGRTLRAAIDAGLDPAMKVRIAEQIAAVLVATHAAGVVHRDLKPGNVMISGNGEVKVLDFGLARSDIAGIPDAPTAGAATSAEADIVGLETNADAPTRLPDADHEAMTQFKTQHGVVMGTAGYMSPEQAAGKVVTAASDMFSFGLVLQELFTGARDGSRPADGIDRDLAALIHRLRSTAPSERPTAAEAAARLAWIRDKPRRRLRMLAIVASIVIAIAGALKYTVDLARERTAAVAARDEANSRRAQAESLIDFMLGDLRAKLKAVGRLDILDDVGVKATEYFRAVPEKMLSDAELVQRSTALYQIGTVRIDQGKLEAAMQPLQESLALATALSQRKPDDGKRLFELGQAQFWIGYVHWRRRNLDEALKYFRDYLSVSERLIKIDPANVAWQLELAYADSNIGSVLQERGELPAALERFEASLRIRERVLAAAPGNDRYRRAVASTNNTVATVLERLGRFDEALKRHRAELQLQQELVRRDPQNADWLMFLAVATEDIGIILEAQGNTGVAVNQFRESVDMFERLSTRDPANAIWQRELGRARFRLGHALLSTDVTQARAELQRAVAILSRIVQSDPSNVGWLRDLAESHEADGEARLAAGDLDGAAKDADAALQLTARALRQSAGDSDAARIGVLAEIIDAQVLMTRGSVQAEGKCRAALSRIEPLAKGATDYRLLDPWARALACAGRRAEAQSVLERLEAMGYRSAPLPRSIWLREPSTVR